MLNHVLDLRQRLALAKYMLIYIDGFINHMKITIVIGNCHDWNTPFTFIVALQDSFIISIH